MLCRKDKTGDDGTDLYIGSTSQPLEERLRCHKKDAQRSRNVNNRLYKRMGQIGLQNWKIIPLVTFVCVQKTIFGFEKQWIDLIGADLNVRSPITDRKKYNAGYYLGNKKAI